MATVYLVTSHDAEQHAAMLTAATGGVDPPLAVLDLAGIDANAADLRRRAGGLPIRVASKSVRCRAVLADVLALPGFAGVLAYTLDEALWLVATGVSDDVVVAYPSVHHGALRALATDDRARAAITIMVDDEAQLDLVDAAAPGHPPIRVCLELDASWRPVRGMHLGVRRSPVHRVVEARALAESITRRSGFVLDGLMAYEAQIAGLANAPPGHPLRGVVTRAMQRGSAAELAERRAAAIAAVGSVAPLRFVNGGGTGSLERTAAEGTCTELAAGSGLYGPALFDGYAAFRPRPAVLFAVPVVRRPGPGTITVAGGGFVASGAPGPDRLPAVYAPAGLGLTHTEGAGEVQTPLVGPGSDGLRPGDRVWLRHAKAGELAEHVDRFHRVRDGILVDEVPTYRGEGRTFG